MAIKYPREGSCARELWKSYKWLEAPKIFFFRCRETAVGTTTSSLTHERMFCCEKKTRNHFNRNSKRRKRIPIMNMKLWTIEKCFRGRNWTIVMILVVETNNQQFVVGYCERWQRPRLRSVNLSKKRRKVSGTSFKFNTLNMWNFSLPR